MRRTTVFGVYDGGIYGALERVARSSCRCRRRISRASGSGGSSPSARCSPPARIERPIVFGGNDRPGVMLASAVRTYLNRFGVAPRPRRRGLHRRRRRLAHGRRSARRRASSVAAIVDARREVAPAVRALAGRRRAVHLGAAVADAQRRPARARRSRSSIGDGRRSRDRRRSRSRCRAAGIRSSASRRHLGGKPRWRDEHRGLRARRTAAGHERRGRRGGRLSRLRTRCARAARPASPRRPTLGLTRRRRAVPARRRRGRAPSRRSGVSPASSGKAFVDFQNDVTVADIALAAREGFRFGRASEALHHARHGDRPGQDLQRRRPRDHGGADRPHDPGDRHDARSGRPTRRSRSAPSPAHHRGKAFRPTRLTPAHDWAKQQGAVFVEAGAWLRAQ